MKAEEFNERYPLYYMRIRGNITYAEVDDSINGTSINDDLVIKHLNLYQWASNNRKVRLVKDIDAYIPSDGEIFLFLRTLATCPDYHIEITEFVYPEGYQDETERAPAGERAHYVCPMLAMKILRSSNGDPILDTIEGKINGFHSIKKRIDDLAAEYADQIVQTPLEYMPKSLRKRGVSE